MPIFMYEPIVCGNVEKDSNEPIAAGSVGVTSSVVGATTSAAPTGGNQLAAGKPSDKERFRAAQKQRQTEEVWRHEQEAREEREWREQQEREAEEARKRDELDQTNREQKLQAFLAAQSAKAEPLEKTQEERREEKEQAEAFDRAAASNSYTQEYIERMRIIIIEEEKQKNMRESRAFMESAKPFIGFSLARVRPIPGEPTPDGLLVEAVYDKAPAGQCKITPGDTLLEFNREKVVSHPGMRDMVSRCKVGHLVEASLRGADGTRKTVQLWIMTDDERHRSKPYFFDKKNATKKETKRN